ncbi:MAG TPA: integrase [Pseudomonas sp.]|nr:integrase [Pseudomonas sp.]MAQ50053.1 integrase [Pseudomonas sp.]MBB51975.1 integrase [Pseudomonadales bacterium]HCA23629.1 integrase [Pseudomonas sp.]|tara:strand:- start:5026 stop:6786 length:1761 start_codon:yes stop_codon:yes gene_type:complete
MNPVLMQEIQAVARQAEAAGRGERRAILEAGAARLGMSVPTLYRKLQEVTVRPQRKRRSDAGKTGIPLKELQLISALLVESIRKNQKQLSSVKLAVERLRSNGLIMAGRVNEQTGEFKAFSTSAISRALYQANLHPDQVLAPAPAVSLASRHPNHVWQVDASISTQFYLADDGAAVMDQAQFYDGKPGNLRKIERQRLWRYVITDHASGAIYVQYVLGAESAENLCHVLISCMQYRGVADPFHGVPWALMTDPGAAMTSAMFRNLCQALSIDLIINEVGNARAKGQVEQAHNIVECQFESGLKLVRATTLEQINELAGQWMRHYNGVAIHSRHRSTRFAVWQRITAEQLRVAPAAEVCRELAICEPEQRKVSPLLRVSYRGADYDVSTVPGVLVGEKLLLTRNPWRDADSAQVVVTNEEGRRAFHVVERIQLDEFGFATTAATIGSDFKSHSETPAQAAKKVLEQLATETQTEEEAKAARKAKALPFGGRIDPNKHITDTELPAYLPKRGTELETNTDVAAIEPSRLTHFAAAKRVMGQFPEWGKEHFAALKAGYPDGVLETELDAVVEAIRAALARPKLSVVGGK